jgi:hypothetical protein
MQLYSRFVGFEVLAAVVIDVNIFWEEHQLTYGPQGAISHKMLIFIYICFNHKSSVIKSLATCFGPLGHHQGNVTWQKLPHSVS